ncbi:hypothetical protein [Nocardia jinanensis]|uniref:SDR family NAD(P)-dependent oxidoreductase n=1 Tax=Nocardia jinanensis TaxID=382504 RepID=A0A917VUV2_9NOCA|nr:hypothetical protein [Nocardia jinanensis]GGL16843.1 hypothetical protein GCM10011588_34410 [Nocardia jinanensis]
MRSPATSCRSTGTWPSATHATEHQRVAIVTGGGRGIAVRADISDAEQATALITAMTTELGPPTVLVNNAVSFLVGAEGCHVSGEEVGVRLGGPV